MNHRLAETTRGVVAVVESNVRRAEMHIPDLSTHCYVATGARLRAIGWLEEGHTFEKGSVAEVIVSLLREHFKDPFGVVDFMGSHQCSLCRNDSAPHGNGQLFVPTKDVCYVAPDLISHYVEDHRYKPPAEFIDALLKCPPQSSPAYMAAIAPFMPELTSDW